MKLLVVEDEQTIALALKTGLLQDGFEVDVASDGAMGLWMASENCYGVILLDLMLPKLDGLTICKRLRQSEDFTPILMITAKGADVEVAEGLAIGADDYLTKPFSYMVLHARVKALLRRPRMTSDGLTASSLIHGEIKLDYSKRKVFCNDQDLNLSKREFSLFETLLLASGRVLSKQFLLRQVWGDEFEGDENVVEVYIGYLRRKLASMNCKNYIITVRGSGYRVAM